jgi:hypothetical protein
MSPGFFAANAKNGLLLQRPIGCGVPSRPPPVRGTVGKAVSMNRKYAFECSKAERLLGKR